MYIQTASEMLNARGDGYMKDLESKNQSTASSVMAE